MGLPPTPGLAAGELDMSDQLTPEETSAIAELLRQGLPERQDGGDLIGASSVRGINDAIVLRYDLVAGSMRKGDDLPGLQLLHERFVQELGDEFRRTVGVEGQLFPERLTNGKFAEIYARLTLPTALLIANMRGIGCMIIIAMEPHLALHFIDLLMGGEGGVIQMRGDLASRGFTQAEKGILRHLTGIFSRAMKVAWSEIIDVEIDLARVATDPRHAAIYEPSEAMVELGIRVEWGDVLGAIRIVLPTSFLGQFEDALSRTATPSQLRIESSNLETMKHNLGPVEVTVSAILGRAELNLERLLSLEPGQIIRLDSDPEEPLVICVEDVPKLNGFPTMQRGNLAFEVHEFLPSALALEASQSPADAAPAPPRESPRPSIPGDPDARPR
jgi:flagellar motor switch protein FliM